MSEWKYIDSIAELSDFECAHCDTRDFYMVTYDTISQPWKVLNKFLKKNRIIVEQCSFNKDEKIHSEFVGVVSYTLMQQKS